MLNPLVPPDDPNPYALWQEGCFGIPETKGFLALEGVEAGHPDWQQANLDWINRARQGPGVAGGPDPAVPTKTSYLFRQGMTPYGRSWGAPFAPTATCLGLPSPSPSFSESPSISPSITPEVSLTPEPTITPEPTEPPTPPITLPPTTPTPEPTEPPTEPPSPAPS